MMLLKQQGMRMCHDTWLKEMIGKTFGELLCKATGQTCGPACDNRAQIFELS
jgi:hypothetical protein